MNIINKIIILTFFIALLEITLCKPTKSPKPIACQKILLTQQTLAGRNISLWMLNLLTFLTSIFFLVALGIIKGLFGILCCVPVGMWGLGSLIDLPQPLEHYQEKELKGEEVVYDDTGWPVHPNTGKRSVRALARKTEFCLNTVFFLTYPLAIILTLFSSCCFQESEDDEDRHCQCVNNISFDYAEPRRTNARNMTKARTIIKGKEFKKDKNKKMYGGDDDSTEEKDTKYVKKQMKRSKSSRRKS